MNNNIKIDHAGTSQDLSASANQQDDTNEVHERGWLGELLNRYYNSSDPDTEVDGDMETGTAEDVLPDRWRDASLAAEYICAMQEFVPRHLESLSRTPFTRFVQYLFSDAGVTGQGPVWRWLGVSQNSELDVASAREFGKLAVALRVPMALALSSIQCELAERWHVQIPKAEYAFGRKGETTQVPARGAGSRDSDQSRSLALESAADLQPFQLMDLRLIAAEVRAAYGDFE